MAKVTNQNIPPELLDLYDSIASPNKVFAIGTFFVRVDKGARKPTKKKKKNLDIRDWYKLAANVEKQFFTSVNLAPPPDFQFNLVKDLIKGIVNTDYFEIVEPTSSTLLRSLPTSVQDPNPPPYAYRDDTLLPSLPTYPDGTVSSGQSRTSGQKNGNLFVDGPLYWRKNVFVPKAFKTGNGVIDCFIQWQCNMAIDTDKRASRPLLSLNIKAALSGKTTGAAASTAAPIVKRTTLYWRLMIPVTQPPYFHAVVARSWIKPLKRIAKQEPDQPSDAVTINSCPRPMMGRGFNNNTQTTQSISADPILWEIKRGCTTQKFNWTKVSNAQALRSPVWNAAANLWIVLGDLGGGFNSRILTSPDLVNFTTRLTALSQNWSRPAYSPALAKWLCVQPGTDTPRMATSVDGITWTGATPSPLIKAFQVVWSSTLSKFVASNFESSQARALTSSDGINWSTASGGGNAQGGQIAVRETPLHIVIPAYTGGPFLSYSTDGQTFQPCIVPNSALTGHACAYSPTLDLWVAFALSTTPTPSYTSTDGITWTASPVATVANAFSVDWYDELRLFIVGGSNTYRAGFWVSCNGIDWVAGSDTFDLLTDSFGWNTTTKKASARTKAGTPFSFTTIEEMP